MLEIALGFFIALIVIISCTALAFLYPLTLRVSVSQGHVPLQTAPGSDDGGAPEVTVRDNGEGGHSFEYIEAVLITVKKGKDLRLRAEAMARVHSEQRRSLDLHPHLQLLVFSTTAAPPPPSHKIDEPPNCSTAPSLDHHPARRSPEHLRGARPRPAAHAHANLTGQQLPPVQRELLGAARPRV